MLLLALVNQNLKLLQKADCNFCPTNSDSSEVIESLCFVYTSDTSIYHFNILKFGSMWPSKWMHYKLKIMKRPHQFLYLI